MLHWLICKLCHINEGGTEDEYMDKCIWLMTRGGSIKSIHGYNYQSTMRQLAVGKINVFIMPVLSFLNMSDGDTHNKQYAWHQL